MKYPGKRGANRNGGSFFGNSSSWEGGREGSIDLPLGKKGLPEGPVVGANHTD